MEFGGFPLVLATRWVPRIVVNGVIWSYGALIHGLIHGKLGL